ncbi:MAG: hypothetical protein PHF21_04435 [Bacilli bacterium]|nr:hypothetical protein [Bacilli bacterium]
MNKKYRLLKFNNRYILQKKFLFYYLSQQFDLPTKYTYLEGLYEVLEVLTNKHKFQQYIYYTCIVNLPNEQYKKYIGFDNIKEFIDIFAEEFI